MSSKISLPRWLATAVLLACCGWALSIWVSAGAVQWVATQTEHRLDVSPAERAGLVDRLQTVAGFTPASPMLLEALVRLEPAPGKQLDFLEQLLVLRPADSEALARQFSLRLDLGLNDEATDDALRNSLAVGGWEPRALEMIVDAGTFHWLALSAEARGLVLEAARRRLINPHGWRIDEMLRLIRSRGFLRITCAALAEQQPELPGYCLNYR